MKKILLSFVLTLMSVLSSNAQSFELHQSYSDNKSPYGETRMIVSYFWTSENGKWNVFSWNNYSKSGLSGLLYGEYLLGSNIYAHAEVRANAGNFEYKTITPQVGLAYRIPWAGGPDIYLTPKYSYNDIAKHDIQFSVNSSFENDHFYYEGYIDSNWIDQLNVFAEQKAYYKITKNIQLGALLVFNSTTGYNSNVKGSAHLQPYASIRVALY